MYAVSPGTGVTPTASEPVPTGSTVPSGIPPTGSFCEEFELRSTRQTTSVTVGDLVNRRSVFVIEGNIEVCVGGSFYSICDEGWSDDAAQFVCNYFGYDPRIYGKLIQLYNLHSAPMINISHFQLALLFVD